jgi:3-oxoacyl-[acyl-carrier-protein] synthase-3
MRWSRVCLESITAIVPEERVPSREIEDRLRPFYARHHLAPGQLEALSGIEERRFWPAGTRMARAASEAGELALLEAGISAQRIGALVYCGVCRDDLEPSTATGVADRLGVRGDALVFDVGSACLGALVGLVQVANLIELGQIEAGLVVSAESAREIADTTVERLLQDPTLETWRSVIASLTGGSAAIAMVLTRDDLSWSGRHLRGAVAQAAPEHQGLARWGSRSGLLAETPWVMETDGSSVLQAGVALGRATAARFEAELGWGLADLDRVVMHQVGASHQRAILDAFALPQGRDFTTFRLLGNTGSCALPLTLARAVEEGAIRTGDRVGLLGIGTGLHTLFLGLAW